MRIFRNIQHDPTFDRRLVHVNVEIPIIIRPTNNLNIPEPQPNNLRPLHVRKTIHNPFIP